MSVAYAMMKRLRTYAQLLAAGALILILTALAADRWVFPLPVEKLTRPHARFVYDREGRLLHAYTSSDRYWRKPVQLDEISPLLIKTVLRCEDQWFYYHPGVNFISLTSATWQNLKAGKVVRGGSTITMQVARMMEPKARTIGNKLVEIARALQLEAHYSKDELLEFYFNLVPYGGNIEGVGAACLFYFDKAPEELSLSECAILAAIPVSPSNFRPDLDMSACRQRRVRVLSTLKSGDVISETDALHAESEEIPSERVIMPQIAPHHSQSLTASFADSVNLRSTIDRETQMICERLARGHHARLTPMEINNLSIVVLDNASGEVLALVGSPDFSDSKNQGQINGALAPRSPGSALKPFAYAVALEDGLATASTRLADIPVNYAGYSPENYDAEYHGIVSVSEALVHSYNVPAVKLTAQVGLKRFFDLLKDGGLNTLKGEYYNYGLPLVLGGCEVTLLELSNLYATLARGGSHRDIRELVSDTAADSCRLLSPEVAYLVSDMLADLKRPDLPTSWEFTRDLPKIAWKTGTSYGRRDAWTIGYNPKYTVGVWAGNFDGEGSIDIVGAEIAAPIMFDVFNEISGGDVDWFEQPPGISVREVCAVSGMPTGEHCPEKVLERYIPGKSPSRTCDVHQAIMVDRSTGYRLCRYCSDGCPHDEIIVENWPARLASWLKSVGRYDPIPPHNPNCAGIMYTERPMITSPEAEAEFVLIDGVPSSYQKILLEASAASGCKEIHWFVDRKLYASCDPVERIFYTPTEGRHELMCLDDQGRSRTIAFVVK